MPHEGARGMPNEFTFRREADKVKFHFQARRLIRDPALSRGGALGDDRQ